MTKLNQFYKEHKIFRYYLNYLQPKLEKDKLFWISMGLEMGPMENLYNILKQIPDDNDSIWSKLFDLCIMDEYVPDQWNLNMQHNEMKSDEEVPNGIDEEKFIRINGESEDGKGESIADYVTEQSVANFIALSIKYYCLDYKLQGREDKTTINAFNLEKELTEIDKYLLSIVLPKIMRMDME